ncbi:hypothetical protein BCR34DRAFT_230399 [Clohesyomyces aquaticus]|uniref:Transcription factor domain-containing protein n=1 Tax=Clohesyomyces aquaticus TaxID=1231657 RepID=A0A1Y1Y7M6_9PLEO|nr:hypothetical protein BCR34DRAFT_230399 [Clohesyomyces aquaticus]
MSVDAADAIFLQSVEVLDLCASAMSFCYAREDGAGIGWNGRYRVEVWESLLQRFNKWYADRPEGFHAVIELSPMDGNHSEHEFPVLVFTSGAAILANQLYHTGMFLLLRNKPKFARDGGLNSVSSSVLLHVHRVCGIAMNNDLREFWDPCLVASLLVVASTTTHRSQHAVILHTLERVQSLTGWDIALHVSTLKEEWRLARVGENCVS